MAWPAKPSPAWRERALKRGAPSTQMGCALSAQKGVLSEAKRVKVGAQEAPQQLWPARSPSPGSLTLATLSRQAGEGLSGVPGDEQAFG